MATVERLKWKTAEDVLAYLKGKQIRISLGDSGAPFDRGAGITVDGETLPATSCKINMHVGWFHSVEMVVSAGYDRKQDEWRHVEVTGEIVDGEFFALDDPERQKRIEQFNNEISSGNESGRA